MNIHKGRPPLHITSANQFGTGWIESLFDLATSFRTGTGDSCMRDRILVSLFYESSTRTRLSFESAALRLGGSVIGTENAREFSSAVKGESLEDSISVLGGYGDVIVLRHYDDDAAVRAAAISTIPVINAGSGKGEHPTQALLDLYTIQDRLGRTGDLRIAFVGDLKHGRTIHSLCRLLGMFKNQYLAFIAPDELQIGAPMLSELGQRNIRCETFDSLVGMPANMDVIYVTRIQSERLSETERPALQELGKPYRIDRLTIDECIGPHAMIMHPLPRTTELDPSVDSLQQAAYFEQARNGLYVRMALLNMIFKGF